MRHALVLGHQCFALYFFHKAEELRSLILTHFLMMN